jgi:hypothetical protein
MTRRIRRLGKTTSDNVSFSEVVRGDGARLPLRCIMGPIGPTRACSSAETGLGCIPRRQGFVDDVFRRRCSVRIE